MARLIFDIETNGLLEDLTDVHCMCVIDADTGKEWALTNSKYKVPCDGTLEDGLKLLEAADTLVGHNVLAFDLQALAKVFGWAPRAGTTILDTRLAAQLCWSNVRNDDFANRKMALVRKLEPMPAKMIGQHTLKAWGHRLGVHKGDYGDNRTDWSTFDSAMLRYNMQDCRVTHRLLREIDKAAPAPEAMALEHAFAAVMQHQERNGFLFDKDAAMLLCAELTKERARLSDELMALFPPRRVKYLTAKKRIEKVRVIPFNPSSRDHIAANLVEKYNWTPTEFSDGGKPKIDEEVLSRLPYPEAKSLGRYFLLEKRLGSLAEGNKAWMKMVKPDGRIHGGVIITGTPHGRCSHVNPNMAQVPRVGSPYGAECRALFIAPPGWKLVGCDAAGMQLRALAHYLARHDGGEYVKVVTEKDPHAENMRFMGLSDRSHAKTCMYAWLFGAGEEHLGALIGGTKKDGKDLITKMFDSLPALKRLVTDVKGAAKARGWLKGLDGRRIPVPSQHCALNYLLAGFEAVVMKQATVMIQPMALESGLLLGSSYRHVAHVHDEIQLEALDAAAQDIGRIAAAAIVAAGEHFSTRCPMRGDFKVGATWRETH